MVIGTVYLIGAGPGDPELLTLKAKRLLEMADIVLYDYLAHPNIIMIAPKAKKICVGKKKGGHSMKQTDINQLMLDYSLEVQHIVRLKGGDPMIFGRCGEEMSFLNQHNIPYEIIPGISSAISAPTYAGIPITHRGLSQSVAFVTATRENDVENMNIPIADTLVMMMSLLRLESVVARLLTIFSSSTPIAIIESGTLAEEKVLVGTLSTISKLQDELQLKPPALLVVGDVAALGKEFSWRDHLPLRNRRFVLFRAYHQQSQLRDRLYHFGAEVLSLPLNNIKFDKSALFDYDIKSFTYIVFTSENGVNAFFECLAFNGQDIRSISNSIIIAIGNHTTESLKIRGITPDLIPDMANSDGVIELLLDRLNASDQVLIPTSSEANDNIINGLQDTGASFSKVITYKNLPQDDLPDGLNWIKASDELIFMNAASVRRFFAAVDPNEYLNCRIYSIGPKTTAEIRLYTKQTVYQASNPTIDEIIDTIQLNN